MKAEAKDAEYWRSIKEGIDNMGIGEIFKKERNYWYDRRKEANVLHSNVDWQYEYK